MKCQISCPLLSQLYFLWYTVFLSFAFCILFSHMQQKQYALWPRQAFFQFLHSSTYITMHTHSCIDKLSHTQTLRINQLGLVLVTAPVPCLFPFVIEMAKDRQARLWAIPESRDTEHDDRWIPASGNQIVLSSSEIQFGRWTFAARVSPAFNSSLLGGLFLW